MIKWRKNGTIPTSGAKFGGYVFTDPSYSTGGFRDPTTAWQGTDKIWRMATGCGDRKKGGACLFKSADFAKWDPVGWLHHPQGPENTAFWECPDFFPIPGTDAYVLKGSASGDWWSVGKYTEVAGSKDADTFTPSSYDVHDGSPAALGLQKYDFGQFYASKTFYDSAKKRQILWGWVAEEGSSPHSGEDWSSIQSLPRTVSLDPANSTRLIYAPISELEALRGSATPITSTTVKAGGSFALPTGAAGRQLDIVINITADFTKAGVMAGVSVFGETCPVTIGGIPAGGNPDGVPLVKLDACGHTGQALLGSSTGTVSLRVLVDRSVVEAYAADGRAVATKRIYPTLDQTAVSLVNTGSVDVTISGVVYPMAVAQPPALDDLVDTATLAELY